MAELKQARIKFKKDKLDNEGELQPDISVKVDELFIRWFNLPSTQRVLKDGLRQIRQKYKKNEVKKHTDLSASLSRSSSQILSPAVSADKPLLSPRRKSLNKASLSTSLQESNGGANTQGKQLP